MLTWFGWLMIILLGLTGLGNVVMIGKPRQVQTPGWAAISILLNALLIVGIVTIGTTT